MIPVLSRAQMRAFDQHAIEVSKVPSLLLMENAGRGAADVIERELLDKSARGRRVVVVCGTGNNGGDGFVVARHLMGRGAHVTAWLVGDLAKTTPDCRTNHDAYVGVGGRVEKLGGMDLFAASLADADVAVDALFGTGLDRVIVEPIAGVVRALLDSPVAIAALDVPSGLNADTGVAMGATVEADITISFAHLKLAHVTGYGARKSGTVHVVDIGVPPDLRAERTAALVSSSDVRALLLPRAIDSHKYKNGHVLLLAGSPGKVGAALLAARGALRGGAGAASILTWPGAVASLEAKIPEVMVSELPSLEDLDEVVATKRAVVIGPGFGTNEEARKVSRQVLRSCRGAIIVDADAFTLHAQAPTDFAIAGGRAILTPHSGELARLLGKTSDEVEADRFMAARDAAKATSSIVLLKGAYTIVAAPDDRMVVIGSGTPALATAGAGDVLAGLIGALACSLPPFEAAYVGAFLHGVSGSAWAKEHGDRGLLASEIAEGLPGVFGALETLP